MKDSQDQAFKADINETSNIFPFRSEAVRLGFDFGICPALHQFDCEFHYILNLRCQEKALTHLCLINVTPFCAAHDP